MFKYEFTQSLEVTNLPLFREKLHKVTFSYKVMNVFMTERRLDVKTFSRFLEQLEEDSEHMTDSWSRGVNPYFEHD